jgi:hypothetical protein
MQSMNNRPSPPEEASFGSVEWRAISVALLINGLTMLPFGLLFFLNANQMVREIAGGIAGCVLLVLTIYSIVRWTNRHADPLRAAPPSAAKPAAGTAPAKRTWLDRFLFGQHPLRPISLAEEVVWGWHLIPLATIFTLVVLSRHPTLLTIAASAIGAWVVRLFIRMTNAWMSSRAARPPADGP